SRRSARTLNVQIFARYGLAMLIAGLVMGIALPPLARILEPWLTPLIGGLLFLSAWRIGWRNVLGQRADALKTLILVAALQVALPLTLAFVFMMLGWTGPLAQAVVLMSAGATIAGSANITQFLGHDGSAALRLLVVGTAALPLTVLPVFAVSGIAGAEDIGTFALRLLALIGVSAGLGFLARRLAPKVSAASLDGAGALLMALVVIGIMAEVGPALVTAPGALMVTLAVAFAAGFGLQVASYLAQQPSSARVAVSVVAGNRNMALFIAALPTETIAPLMLFIGCYQVPMYLTPVLLSRFYGPAEGAD
ncbi:MAG: hypothetical protein AAFO70_07440, partial [Pseudomonadota bacterium]